MDLNKFSPKDKKLIKDNPGKSAYELLQLGLSQPGYQRILDAGNDPSSSKQSSDESLTNQQAAKSDEPGLLQPSKVETVVTEGKPAKPILSAKATVKNGTVNVYNKRLGRNIPMDAKAAERLVSTSPNEYWIV